MTGPVLLAGGGTAGHVFPSLAVAGALRAAGLAPEFVGTAGGLEARLVPEAGWTLHAVPALPLRRRLSWDTLRLPGVVARSTLAALRLIRARRARGAVCFGGYVAVPLALAATRGGIPLVVHEQNAVPGLANRLAALRADAVAVTYPETVERFGSAPTIVTGNPVRPGLADVDLGALRAEALAAFGLSPDRRTLLVFGGSQGARRLNEAAVAAASAWADPAALQVLHITGHGQYEAARRAWGSAPGPLAVCCVDFVRRMDLAYAVADVVVSRAGASTIAELTVLGLPAVLVPYPHATADHQTANAVALRRAGGATVVPDADLDAGALVAAAQPLLTDEAARGAMAACSRAFGRPDAARRVADAVLTAVAARPRAQPRGRR
ncbi:MAG: undecaprenyldiphospho-muramoylpentapeptide beta-N-acetylglucosaminyltransferase [Actinobacteria bacterium]|nr:undecaprenyldiphospho-muramoylpentapeptide beta-N-acetylglucosaminyltransferase [Actinomycetota bacterium]